MNEELYRTYNFRKCQLKPDEKFIYIYSDGMTRQMLFAVLILNESGEWKVMLDFVSKRRRHIYYEGTGPLSEEVDRMIAKLSAEPEAMQTLDAEYDFGYMDNAKCLLGFRVEGLADQQNVRIDFPFGMEELEQRFTSEVERSIMDLSIELNNLIYKRRSVAR